MSLSLKSLNFARKILKHNNNLKDISTNKSNENDSHIVKDGQSCCGSQNQKNNGYNGSKNRNECCHEKCQNTINQKQGCNTTNQSQNLPQHQHQHEQQIKPYLHAHDHRKQREIYQKSTQQKLKNMKTFKEQGNDHYKNQRFKQAAYLYQKIIIYADYTFPESKPEQQELCMLTQQANCNLGITFVKQQEWQKSESFFIHAKRGSNVGLKSKSIYWLSKIYLKKGQIQKTINQISQLKSLSKNKNDQNQKQVQELQMLLEKQRERQSKASKKLYQNMFSQRQKQNK